ncbi:Oidioi.mRNA.OKI2018_I69.PAR.g12926.t1.cds [Oikopleura dioica]|uniref:Oidioi.mRNA.OKI2018_I69.PAR.g12926.t1.cds n=1 Tax=Oikopleura dioica TaxID=34765 RepID=A0ABN7S460_OIKDI|nr:Oidioi.mRNA.OKI2018_I69.PAR.g12926.t1.cds [Oikopleura dioica]
MGEENYEQLSIDRINKILMSARFASCSYESVESLKQLQKEVEQEKLGHRPHNDSFIRNEQKMLFRRFENIKFKHIRDDDTSADAIIFLATEKDIRDLGSNQKPKTFIVIGVAGTYELGDVAQDLKVFQTNFEDTDAKVHSGFYAQFKALKVRVESILQIILKDNSVDEIIITGHSLGGAVSAMIKEHLRVRVTKDPITKVPPLFYWFRHTCENDSAEDFPITDDSIFSIPTHSCVNYIDELKKIKGGVTRRKFRFARRNAKHFTAFHEMSALERIR